jgi:hypothetical protein
MKKIFISLLVVFAITSCSEYKFPNLGNAYKFYYHGKYALYIVDTANTIIIERNILEYGVDSTFIVVSQRPWNIPNVKGLEEMNYDKRRETFENSKFKQYWIINKNKKAEYSLDTLKMRAKYSNVYGPFEKKEYILKCEELGVSKEIQLKKTDL